MKTDTLVIAASIVIAALIVALFAGRNERYVPFGQHGVLDKRNGTVHFPFQGEKCNLDGWSTDASGRRWNEGLGQKKPKD